MAEDAGSGAALMCNAQLIELLCMDPQEEALGIDCRGWRFIRNLFDKKDE